MCWHHASHLRFCIFFSLVITFSTNPEPDALEAYSVSLSHQGASVPPWDIQLGVYLRPEPSSRSQAVPPCLPNLLFFSSCSLFSSLLAPTDPPGLPVNLLPQWGAGGGVRGLGCGPTASSSCFTWEPQGLGTTTLPRCVNFNRYDTKKKSAMSSNGKFKFENSAVHWFISRGQRTVGGDMSAWLRLSKCCFISLFLFVFPLT